MPILSYKWMKSLPLGVIPVEKRPKPIKERFWWLEHRSPWSEESFKASRVTVADSKCPNSTPEIRPTAASATVWPGNNFFLTVLDPIKPFSSSKRLVELIPGVVPM
jgi:hypothetical protein